MNTENEYQLLKRTYEIIKNKKIEMKDFNHYPGWEQVKINSLKSLKLRLFILNLNLRPQFPIPEDIQMKIKRTALIDELKEHDSYINKRNNIFTPLMIMEKMIFHNTFLYYLKSVTGKTDTTVYYAYDTPLREKSDFTKKEFLQVLLEENGVQWKKSWTIKKLIQEYMKF